MLPSSEPPTALPVKSSASYLLSLKAIICNKLLSNFQNIISEPRQTSYCTREESSCYFVDKPDRTLPPNFTPLQVATFGCVSAARMGRRATTCTITIFRKPDVPITYEIIVLTKLTPPCVKFVVHHVGNFYRRI